MFIETLEFTIPVELCTVFTTLQKGRLSNVEFPASVNSYGTTQDANVQVQLRANKLTFKVDGVSSSASMISKSECKTLKLSVFDVDRSLMPQDDDSYDYNNVSPVQQSVPLTSSKRVHEQSVSLPPAKSSRTSYSDSPRPRSPGHRRSQPQSSPRPSEHSQPRSHSENSYSQSKPESVNVKQEPEDPDLIEIEPDDIIEPKKEVPYMQLEYSSNAPRVQTSHSQSPASSSSSFHHNVPHVQDYAEPGPSQGGHGDQTADDYLVFQDQDDNNEEYDEDADYGNDDAMANIENSGVDESVLDMSAAEIVSPIKPPASSTPQRKFRKGKPGVIETLFHNCPECTYRTKRKYHLMRHMQMHNGKRYSCDNCEQSFQEKWGLDNHNCTRGQPKYVCHECGKSYQSKQGLNAHEVAKHGKEGKFKCGICNAMFDHKLHFLAHVDKHNAIKRNKCHICSQIFGLKCNLDRHLKTCGSMTSSLNYSCNECGKSFNRKDELSDHMKGKHSQNPRYRCPQCGKGFAWRAMLHRHIKSC